MDKSSGQQLPRECRPSSDSSRCPCRPLGPPATVTPGRLLASPDSPHKGRTDWLLSPSTTTRWPAPGRAGGVVCVVWCGVWQTLCACACACVCWWWVTVVLSAVLVSGAAVPLCPVRPVSFRDVGECAVTQCSPGAYALVVPTPEGQ